MPVPNGYVGYTVTQPVAFQTCVNAHANLLHTPSMTGQIARAAAGGAFSLFEFVITLNNLNGAKPVPAGNVIVARVDHAWSRLQPCNQPRQPAHRTYYEKFGPNSVDVQFFITGCNSRLCYHRVVEYAIMPDPAPGVAIPAGENAVSFPMPAAGKAAFTAAMSLQLYSMWDYDNCNNPRQTKTGKTHYFEFTAKTFDPAGVLGRPTWTLPGSPLPFDSN